ncbi:MAG: DUF2238 domain-containing protein [Bacteroidales bacterium]|nr:DUF2238 domain-containing protein [Candidatus Sodaliphilus fimicaballi]
MNLLEEKNLPAILLIAVLVVAVWSVISVEDTYLTWALESIPVWIALPLLGLTYKNYRLPGIIYAALALHMTVLLVGAHYSYANVPLGYWMQDWFGFTRNNYDKIGHFMQGVTPAILTSHILVRSTPLKKGGWVAFLSLSVAMMVSATYEIIEWLVSLSNPEDTEAFLGTQGYIWDTQTDMFMCLLGAVFALTFLKFANKRNG